jgi:tRNA C32,U32 (ribose-2'-O)-methylase TrmJ
VVPIQEAIANCRIAIGWTRRAGTTRDVSLSWSDLCRNHATLREAIAGPIGMGIEDPAPSVALLFGREESGLSTDELLCCTHLCSIPTGRAQPSMNLSHAVAVALAPVFEAVTSGDMTAAPSGAAHCS